MGSEAQTQAQPEEKSTVKKVGDAAGAGMDKVSGAVGGTIDRIDDKMDQEVEIAGIKMPFVTLIMSILIIIGAFFEWNSGNHIKGYEYGPGIIVLVMGILVLVFAAIKKPIGSGVFGVIAFILTLLPLVLIITDDTWGMGDVGIGLWISFIGALLGFIFGFLKK